MMKSSSLAWKIPFSGLSNYRFPWFGVGAEPSRIVNHDSSPEIELLSSVSDEDVSLLPHIISGPNCECWQNSRAVLDWYGWCRVCYTTLCVFKGSQVHLKAKEISWSDFVRALPCLYSYYLSVLQLLIVFKGVSLFWPTWIPIKLLVLL